MTPKQLIKLAIFSVSLHAAPAISTLIVTDTNFGVIANDEDGDLVAVIDQSVTLPFVAPRSAVDGESSATVLYDLSTSGNTGVFSFDYDLARPGSFGASAQGYADVFFNVTEAASFSFTGFAELTGAGRMYLKAALRDLTVSGGPAGFVYQNQQISTATIDEFFVIGGLGGDESNILQGINPGLLLPGHEYLMQLAFDIIAIPEADNGSTAYADFDFTIGAADLTIPVAPPLVLLCLGLIGIGYVHRAKKSS